MGNGNSARVALWRKVVALAVAGALAVMGVFALAPATGVVGPQQAQAAGEDGANAIEVSLGQVVTGTIPNASGCWYKVKASSSADSTYTFNLTWLGGDWLNYQVSSLGYSESDRTAGSASWTTDKGAIQTGEYIYLRLYDGGYTKSGVTYTFQITENPVTPANTGSYTVTDGTQGTTGSSEVATGADGAHAIPLSLGSTVNATLAPNGERWYSFTSSGRTDSTYTFTLSWLGGNGYVNWQVTGGGYDPGHHWQYSGDPTDVLTSDVGEVQPNSTIYIRVWDADGNDADVNYSLQAKENLNPPAIPASVKAKAGKKKVKVTFAAAARATSYQVQIKRKGRSWGKSKKVGSKRSYTFKKLKKGKKYQVRVRAVRKAGGMTAKSSWAYAPMKKAGSWSSNKVRGYVKVK